MFRKKISVFLSAVIPSMLLLSSCTGQTGQREPVYVTPDPDFRYRPVSSAVPQNSFPKAEMVNVTQEIVLTSVLDYGSPYAEASIEAVFTGPEGQTMTVPGYWFGGHTWKIRFAAPSEGEWRYEVSCTNTEDTGLHGVRGALTAEPYTGDNEFLLRGRLRVSCDNEDLTYGDGTPFFWLADTHWFGFSKRLSFDSSNSPDYETMFHGTIDQRAEEGYTAFQAMIWVSSEDVWHTAENEGGSPWIKRWEQPSPSYWRNVDKRVEYIVSKGMVPVIGLDWGGALNTDNYDDYVKIVRYAVARYASYPIVWNLCGEYANDSRNSDDLECYGQLGQFISEVDPYGTLETIHGPRSNYYPCDYFRGQEWFSFVMSEGGHAPTFDYYDNGSGSDYVHFYKEYKDYRESSIKMPWLEAEAKYEDIWEIPTDQTREIAYLAIMNGSFGYSYGVEGGWQDTRDEKDEFQTYWRKPTPWYVALNKIVGTTQMPYMKAFFTSLPFWDLNYDTKSVRWTAEPEGDGVLRPTVNTTSDKRCVVIYYPMNNETVNADTYPEARGSILTGLSKNETYTARWFDPVTGEYTLISDGITVKADGRYALPWPVGLEEHDRVFILTANGAPSIEEEYRSAAYLEQQQMG